MQPPDKNLQENHSTVPDNVLLTQAVRYILMPTLIVSGLLMLLAAVRVLH